MLTKQDNELITRIGPGTPMGELFRRFWIPALLAEELPAPDCPPVRVRLLGEDLVAFKDSDGRIGLLDARCPHRLADLFFGRNEECGLRCVYHGWKFDVAGTCVDMPNEPAESNFKHKVRTTAYPCVERGGVIWTYMGPKEFLPELPQLEWALVPDSHRYLSKRWQRCNWVQAVEGGIDSSHVSFLHGLVAVGQGPSPRPQLVTSRQVPGYVATDTAPRFTVKNTDYGLLIGARRNAGEDSYYWRITQFLMPSYTMIPRGLGPDSPIGGHAWVPIDDENCWVFTMTWHPDRPLTQKEIADIETWTGIHAEVIPGTYNPVRNKDNDYMIDRALQRSYSFTGIKGISEQDMAVQESMGPIVDRSKEHLGTSDTAIIAFRRLMLRAAKALQQGIIPYAAQHGDVYRVRSASAVLDRNVPFDEGAKDLLVAASR